ncbi:MAG TPA: hypothetical protein VL993_09640 [Stellaceae bacterium]|nr:hypothetical protein [Stellaceae bacterium]
MPGARATLRVLAVLAVVNITLAAAVGLELSSPASRAAPTPSPVARATGTAAAVDSASPPPLDAYKAVLDRPLFARTRRPLPPRATEEAVIDASTFALAGITISGAVRIAVMRHGTPPVISHVTEGQSIDGWTIARIADDRVLLRHGATDHTIRLYPDPSGPTTE